MSTIASTLPSAPKRPTGRTITFPVNAPDPRPVTDYDVAYSSPGGNSRVTVTLHQPCVIRSPRWTFVDCADGSTVQPETVTVLSNQAIQFDFTGQLDLSVAFINVPYQDMEVQNFQGGFVRPGARWFRAPK